MERIEPDVLALIRRRVDHLEAQVELLRRENERLTRANGRLHANKEHYRDSAKKLKVSRDKWEQKAKDRRQEILRLRWQLDPDHRRHPLKVAA